MSWYALRRLLGVNLQEALLRPTLALYSSQTLMFSQKYQIIYFLLIQVYIFFKERIQFEHRVESWEFLEVLGLEFIHKDRTLTDEWLQRVVAHFITLNYRPLASRYRACFTQINQNVRHEIDISSFKRPYLGNHFYRKWVLLLFTYLFQVWSCELKWIGLWLRVLSSRCFFFFFNLKY